MEYSHLARVAAAYQGMSVGAFAVHKIRASLIEAGLAKDEEIVGTLLVCQKCSMKLIPGLNASYEISKAKKKFYKNRVVYSCFSCGSRTYMRGVLKKIPQSKPIQGKHIKFTDEDIASILENRPQNLRTLNKKPKKTEVAEAFFSNSKDLYSLFH